MMLLRSLVNLFTASSLLLGASAMAVAQDGVILVANTDQTIELSRSQVRNLYMGGKVKMGFKPVALTPKHHDRIIFNTKVLGLTESRISSYWAQLQFTGRGRPPPEFEEVEALVEHLLTTPGAVGYVPSSAELPAGLMVVYRTVK